MGLESKLDRESPIAGQPLPGWLRTALIGRRPKRTLARILVLVAVCLLGSKFVLLPIRVEGISMLPTYQDDRINFVNRLAYLVHEPRRGDVVAIRLKAGDHILYMKRIVGLPGETVGFHRGHVVIDGRVLDEPYVKRPSDWELPGIKVGPGTYFCVGDNRSMPAEEHTFGRADRHQILGRILF